LAGYYVRFWSRIFAYINTARRNKGGREKGIKEDVWIPGIRGFEQENS